MDRDDLFDFVKGPVKLIRGKGYPFCHSLLIEDEIKVIIDAACDREKLLAIQRQMTMDYLIASHAHEDHLGGNSLFPEALLYAHRDEAPLLEDLECWINSYGADLWSDDKKERWRHFLRDTCHYVPRPVDRNLADGDILELGSVTLEVLHTPGHTNGHCAFYVPEEKILYMADLDLVKAGPYYGDPASDIDDTIRSLTRLKTFDVDVYLTAHGKGIYEGDPASIDRYLDVIYLREEKLLDFLAGERRTLEQIAREGIIYGQRMISGVPWDLLGSERSMMAKHLARLVDKGMVRQEGDGFVRLG